MAMLAHIADERELRLTRIQPKPHAPRRTLELVEISTAEWVDWFNHRRLYEYCGDPPADLETAYYAQTRAQPQAELSNR